ncbi:MAG TPA: glucose 1-dehydrogenase [Nitrolancea sp.]|nr:glucose 1-dehydrogenase [Nitrolancea sp.]
MASTSSNNGKLAGKVALVTGAGSGIGRAISLRFVEEGARVAAASRTLESVEETARLAGGETLALRADVSQEDDVRNMVEQALARFGRIDILVNNAGIGTTKSILECEPEEWDRVFAVNVRGVYLSTRAVLPGMLTHGEGVIINIASALGLVGVPKRAAYCASKGAVITLTKQVATEYAAQGVRCNCICPGTVDSPWVGRLLDATDDPAAARQALEARHPLQRLATTGEIAAAALDLASADAAFMTGSALVMDGGQLAR